MDLLQEIREEIRNFRSLSKAKNHMAQLQKDLDRSYAELHALEKRLDKEYKDYEKLEGKSLKGFFYNVLGSKESQLEKERQEYLQLSLKFDEMKESIKMLEFEQEVMTKKSKQYSVSKAKLANLKRKREVQLLRSNSDDGRKMKRITQNMDATTRLNTDIDEALEVGQDLIGHLNAMIHLLRTARNWGRWDMQGGRSRMYKHKKYTNIDKAKQVAYKIQHVLKVLEREVRDVYPDFEGIRTSFDLDRFNGFTDIFFDNLISDWIVQQKIVNSLNNVKSIHDRVTRIMQSLQVDKTKVHGRYEELIAKKDSLLIGES